MTTHALVARVAKLWKKRTITITEEDPTFKTVYLGNTVTQWAKGAGSVDKPLATLWRNYCQSTKPDIEMRVTVAVSGLKATTREHGLTEYWSHRITYAFAHPSYPKVFCWVYRHEGRKMKPELRCHAVLCSSETKARLMQRLLTERLHQALVEFRKEKQLRQNARLSVVSVLYPAAPRRKVVLTNGGANYRPPLERSKSAPKLGSIEEDRLGEEAADAAAAREAAARRPPPVPSLAEIAEEEEEERTPTAPRSPRPRAFSEPVEPPPAVCRHPADPTATHDPADDSDAASEHSAASVPSDPTGDSDCETLVLATTPEQCRVYRIAGSGRSPPDAEDACHRLQGVVDFGAHWNSTGWVRVPDEDTASDESGYSEEPLKAE
ncbi:protein FAM43A-like [Amphibalanus amphitrite]|uniref:protein FAM43A-like n=1 Tax=Amphibalanus amphitrite TaxID=1232801 RepID=UPI001C91823F|nr:protein FAM43A-like [Amphibalanus amphitrite]